MTDRWALLLPPTFSPRNCPGTLPGALLPALCCPLQSSFCADPTRSLQGTQLRIFPASLWHCSQERPFRAPVQNASHRSLPLALTQAAACLHPCAPRACVCVSVHAPRIHAPTMSVSTYFCVRLYIHSGIYSHASNYVSMSVSVIMYLYPLHTPPHWACAFTLLPGTGAP